MKKYQSPHRFFLIRFHEGKGMYPSMRVLLGPTEDGKRQTLTIQDAVLADGGVYNLEAVNKYGRTAIQGNVTIKGKEWRIEP